MNWLMTIYAALLFFVLTPAILVRLPPKGGKFMVAAVHALVFALIFHFTSGFVGGGGNVEEGYPDGYSGRCGTYLGCRRYTTCQSNRCTKPGINGQILGDSFQLYEGKPCDSNACPSGYRCMNRDINSNNNTNKLWVYDTSNVPRKFCVKS